MRVQDEDMMRRHGDDHDDRTVGMSIAARAGDHASVAEALKAYVEEDSPLVDQASLYSDLVGAALGRVEWMAIAPHFRDAQRGAQS